MRPDFRSQAGAGRAAFRTRAWQSQASPAQDGTVVVAPVDESPIVPDAQFEAAMPRLERRHQRSARGDASRQPRRYTHAPAGDRQGGAATVKDQAERKLCRRAAEDPNSPGRCRRSPNSRSSRR